MKENSTNNWFHVDITPETLLVHPKKKINLITNLYGILYSEEHKIYCKIDIVKLLRQSKLCFLFCKLLSKRICRFKLILSFKWYVHKKKIKTTSLYSFNEPQVDTAKCLWRSTCCGCHYSEPVHPSVNSGSHFSPIDPVCPTVKNNCNKHLKRTRRKVTPPPACQSHSPTQTAW